MTAAPPAIVVPCFDELDRRFNGNGLPERDRHFAPRTLTNPGRPDA
jgi:hypothetical protein